MNERFRIQKHITDSGRSRIWYVMDTHKQLQPWRFDSRPDGEGNRILARTAAMMLNKGHGYD